MVHIPLEAVRVAATGETALRARLVLRIRVRAGWFRPFPFLVDTGTGITTIPTVDADKLGLAVPPRSIELTVRTGAGVVRQRRRPGFITAQISGFVGRVFVWPCHFVDHVASAPAAALGLAGVLDDLRLIFDGAFRSDAPYGTLTLEPRGRDITVRRQETLQQAGVTDHEQSR